MTVAWEDGARRLYDHLLRRHWAGDGLHGPDVGIRLNYRIGRFVKSYVPVLPWHDDLYYLQAQGYWALANWRLATLLDDAAYEAVAVGTADGMLTRQRPDGAWDYPNREWKGRVATAEGTWGSIGLLETYNRTGESRFLEGALRWNAFLENEVGYSPAAEGQAVNYFAGRAGMPVPNNSAFVLRFLAELARSTGDARYGDRCGPLLGFLRAVQKPSGELPYTVGTHEEAGTDHFQCFQYNAFQCLDLLHYEALTGDTAALPLIEGVLEFLATGIAADGHVHYACGETRGRVTYHAAAVAAAFADANARGIASSVPDGERVYRYVLSLQRADGSFPHSFGDYKVLRDVRSYPRQQAMILFHLLSAAGLDPVVSDR